MFYKVTIDEQREWEGIIEAESEEEAKSVAHLEAEMDTVICQNTYCTEIHQE